VFYLNKDIIMIKNCTKFVLIAGIGLSLFSGISHTAFENENDTALVITNLSAPARLGSLALIHDDKQRFSVLRESGEINEIQNHLVARDLREISHSEVKARLDNHINFRVQQGSDGEFSLQEYGGLEGGIGETEKKMAVAGVLLGGSAAGIYKVYRAFQPDIDKQNENSFQQAKRDYIACLLKHPLKESIEGTLGIPSACLESSTKFKMIENAIKVREATQSVENAYNAQQVRLDFNACIHKNPLSESIEGTIGIPSACIRQFNQLKTVVPTMRVRKDTTQN
jgi:hypothetical protein